MVIIIVVLYPSRFSVFFLFGLVLCSLAGKIAKWVMLVCSQAHTIRAFVFRQAKNDSFRHSKYTLDVPVLFHNLQLIMKKIDEIIFVHKNFIHLLWQFGLGYVRCAYTYP